MPSPWLMARASGFYCRVFVPADLRPVLGQRFLVRALDARDRDEARLIAARLALAVGDLYRQLRRELTMAEPKVSDIIASFQAGKVRELILRGLRTPSGASVDEVHIDNAEDARLFKEQFGEVFHAQPAAPAAPPVYRRMAAHGVLTSARRLQYLEHLAKALLHIKFQRSNRRVIQMLIDICGDLPPDDYTPDIIDHFVQRLAFLPLNPEKNKQHRERWAKLDFKRLANEGELMDDVRCISAETVSNHIEVLGGFFTFCKDRRYMEHDSPLLARVKKRQIDKDQPVRRWFSNEDLARIFDPAHYASRDLPHSFWPPLLALYTGARCNEIAQLYLDDIVNDDPGHPERWRIMVCKPRPDQRLKNKFSNRSIPLHPRLIELGFLHYLDDVRSMGFDRVFPSLRYTEAAGYGDGVSDMFSPYLRKKVGITDPNKVFHSFRHYFCNLADNLNGFQLPHIYDLTGHMREGEFVLTYARERNYEAKMAILMALPLPTWELPAYQPGMFLPQLQALKAKRASEAARKERPKIKQSRARVGQEKKAQALSATTPADAPKRFTIKASRPRAVKVPPK